MDGMAGNSYVKGRVRAYRVRAGTREIKYQKQGEETFLQFTNIFWMRPAPAKPITDWCKNLVMYDWAAAVTRLLATGDSRYRIAGMYLEYKNVADPGDVVTPPSFSRAGGISYYNALSGSADVDYLRVPLTAATTASNDRELFPDGNAITYFAQSQGVVGVHGKAFSDANNSKIYGGALVAVPDLADRTQDIVFSRFYLPTNEQQVKLATSNIGLEWEVELQ